MFKGALHKAGGVRNRKARKGVEARSGEKEMYEQGLLAMLLSAEE